MNLHLLKNKIITSENEYLLIASKKLKKLLKYIGFNLKFLLCFERKISQLCKARIKELNRRFSLNILNSISDLNKIENLNSHVRYEINFSTDRKLFLLWCDYEKYFYSVDLFIRRKLSSADL